MVNYARNKPWNVVGYFILAVAVCLGLFAVTQEQTHQAQRLRSESRITSRLSIQQDVLREQQRILGIAQYRSCAAIRGATTFWTAQRAANKLALSDPAISAVERVAREKADGAFAAVIAASRKVVSKC